MDYVYSAKSRSKLREKGWILCLGSKVSASYPKPYQGLIFLTLGRNKGMCRSRDPQIPSNQPYNLQLDISSGNFHQTILSVQSWQGLAFIWYRRKYDQVMWSPYKALLIIVVAQNGLQVDGTFSPDHSRKMWDYFSMWLPVIRALLWSTFWVKIFWYIAEQVSLTYTL